MAEIVRQRDGRWPKEDILSLISSLSSPGDVLVVVYVGAYSGETVKLMLDTGRVAKIYCIDEWVGGYDDSDNRSSSDYVAVEAAFDALLVGDARVVKFKGKFDAFTEYHDKDCVGESIDLVYIDSCRLYTSVVRDIRLSVEHLKPTRALAGYSYTESSVREAVIDTLGRPSYYLFGSWVHILDRRYSYTHRKSFSSNGTPFDVASVLLFSGGDDKYAGREADVLKEFSSVGYDVELFRHTNTAYDTLLDRSVDHKPVCSGHVLSSTLGHLRMIRSAYNRGAKTAIFFEDDIRLLADKDLFRAIVADLPGDFDIALFDWVYPERTKKQDRHRVPGSVMNEHWARFSDLRGSSAYALSRTAMLRMIALLERSASGSGSLKPVDEFYWDMLRAGDINAYAATPNACIRGVPGNSDYSKLLDGYRDIGVAYADYDYVRPEPSVVINSVGLQQQGSTVTTSTSCSADDPVDAVFVIGTGSKNNNEELRYALRNVERNCPFIRNVFISGECPEWVNSKSVIHIKWPDRFRHAKDSNITEKLLRACEDERIAKRVLFCSDDQFQTRVCTWEDFSPVWLRKYERDDTWYDDNVKRTGWFKHLWRTLEHERLRRIRDGKDVDTIYYWEPHIYSPVDRDLFIQFAHVTDYEHTAAAITQTAYYNFVEQRGARSHDHTFAGSATDWTNVKTHIAYTDAGYDNVMSYLTKTFTHKSRFEL